MWFFWDLGFPSSILVNKPLKALCLRIKMVYQHLLYLLSLWTYWHLKITQGPTRYFNGNIRGCKMENFTNGLHWAETAVICDVDKFLSFILVMSKTNEKNGVRKKCSTVPVWQRRGGGSKDIWAMPMETTHFKKGLPLEYDWLIGEWLDTSVLMHHVLVPSTNSIRIAECRQKETMIIDNWYISQSP